MACWSIRLYVFLFILYKEVIGQRQYIFVNQAKNPNDAQLYCQNTYNTSLATVTTMEENEYITSNCKPHNPKNNLAGCIIGLTDKYDERLKTKTDWQWFDGSTNIHFYNWAPNEPNQWDNTEEDCVAIWLHFQPSKRVRYPAGVWNDRLCDGDGQHFFCNAPITSTPTPTTINPTISPSIQPTITPTLTPTLTPTSINPTMSPSVLPTINPTLSPITFYPTTINPSVNPTISPTETTIYPTISPTHRPTISPTDKPSIYPTKNPIQQQTTSMEELEPEMEVTEDKIYDEYQTDAPNTVEINTNNMYNIFVIGLIFCVFVVLCCCIVFVICCFWNKGKKEINYNMKQTSIQITPTDSNDDEIRIEMVNNEEGNVETNRNKNNKEYMKVINIMELPKQTSFELHLTNTNVGTDVLMNDIINDMHKSSIIQISDDECDDEGVIDDDINTTIRLNS